MKKVVLVWVSMLLLASCSRAVVDTTSQQYQTIVWQPDGSGWTQFDTNDPSKMDNPYTYIVPSWTVSAGGTVKVGIKQNSGSPMVLLGIVFGYVNSNNFWVLCINQANQTDSVWLYHWNGLLWQFVHAYPDNGIVLGAGVENDVSVTYATDGKSLTFYDNGTQIFPYGVTSGPSLTSTDTAVTKAGGISALAGTGVGFAVLMDSDENFPSTPMNARFKQY